MQRMAYCGSCLRTWAPPPAAQTWDSSSPRARCWRLAHRSTTVSVTIRDSTGAVPDLTSTDGTPAGTVTFPASGTNLFLARTVTNLQGFPLDPISGLPKGAAYDTVILSVNTKG